MHRLIETTFRESLASNKRCFWLSRTDAIKPVATTPILHHLPNSFSHLPRVPPWTASGPDLLCSGLELPKARGMTMGPQPGPYRVELDPSTCFHLLFKVLDYRQGKSES